MWHERPADEIAARLAQVRAGHPRLLLGRALGAVDLLGEAMGRAQPALTLYPAGALRRFEPTIGDLLVLAVGRGSASAAGGVGRPSAGRGRAPARSRRRHVPLGRRGDHGPCGHRARARRGPRALHRLACARRAARRPRPRARSAADAPRRPRRVGHAAARPRPKPTSTPRSICRGFRRSDGTASTRSRSAERGAFPGGVAWPTSRATSTRTRCGATAATPPRRSSARPAPSAIATSRSPTIRRRQKPAARSRSTAIASRPAGNRRRSAPPIPSSPSCTAARSTSSATAASTCRMP